jgi:hypothetical protein
MWMIYCPGDQLKGTVAEAQVLRRFFKRGQRLFDAQKLTLVAQLIGSGRW